MNSYFALNVVIKCQYKTITTGKTITANANFFTLTLLCLFSFEFLFWLTILLFCCGDIHPNPGPSTTSSMSSLSESSSSTMSDNIFNSLNVSHNLSFVHYNVQSILSKLETLYTELFEFDILAFSETWLSPNIDIDALYLQSYNKKL